MLFPFFFVCYPCCLFGVFFSAQIHETAYQRAARELAAVKKEFVELKVIIIVTFHRKICNKG